MDDDCDCDNKGQDEDYCYRQDRNEVGQHDLFVAEFVVEGQIEIGDEFGKNVDSGFADTAAADIGSGSVMDRFADLVAMGEKWIHSKVQAFQD